MFEKRGRFEIEVTKIPALNWVAVKGMMKVTNKYIQEHCENCSI